MSNRLSQGVVHTVPADLRKALVFSAIVSNAWNSLTPLVRLSTCHICSMCEFNVKLD